MMRPGIDHHRPTEVGQPLLDTEQPQAPLVTDAILYYLRIKADPVILNRNQDGVTLLIEKNVDLVRPGVFNDVSQEFSHAAEQNRVLIQINAAQLKLVDHLDIEAIALFKVMFDPLDDCRAQAELFQSRRAEVKNQLLGFLSCGRECLGDLNELLFDSRIINRVACCGKLQAAQRQVLADVIVQICCDAAS